MNAKLEEKRKKLDEERARKDAERRQAQAEGREYVETGTEGEDGGVEDTVTINSTEVDPNETNKMGEQAVPPDGTNPEGNVSDPNRDTDTHGATDGSPLTHGFQHGNDKILPQTSDPNVNPEGAGRDGEIARAQDTGGDAKAREAVAPQQVSPRTSERTAAEQARGKELIEKRNNERNERMADADRNTVVTDVDDDPDGEKGRKAADKKAASKSKK